MWCSKNCLYGRFGLAEHFQHELKKQITGPYVIMFDESLNTKAQSKQIDIHVRFWKGGVKTRYFESQFLGHATASDMMKHFEPITAQLQLENMRKTGNSTRI